MKRHLLWAAVMAAGLSACHPVDRSGEEPFAPTVLTDSTTLQTADSVRLGGRVVVSPNSHVLECGVAYGNDTLQLRARAAQVADTFSVYTKPLRPGRYYYCAYARNGVGTGWGDTLYVEVR